MAAVSGAGRSERLATSAAADHGDASSSASNASHARPLDASAAPLACAATRNMARAHRGGSLSSLAACCSPQISSVAGRQRREPRRVCQDRPASAVEGASRSSSAARLESRCRVPHAPCSRARRQTCSRTATALLWFYCFMMPSVRSVPPHMRACPGPLDGKDSELCKSRGTATFSAAPYRSPAGVKGSKCFVQAGIMNCTVKLSSGRVLVAVQRQGGFAGQAAVSYSTASGSAESGLDFLPASGRLSWGPFRVLLPALSCMCMIVHACAYVGMQVGASDCMGL